MKLFLRKLLLGRVLTANLLCFKFRRQACLAHLCINLDLLNSMFELHPFRCKFRTQTFEKILSPLMFHASFVMMRLEFCTDTSDL